MGARGKSNQKRKYEQRQTKLSVLSREITELHATVPMAPWQLSRIKEIRAAYEHKKANLDRAHDLACSRLVEDFMEFERDFILASDKFRDENGRDMIWHPKGIRGVLSTAFWINIGRRAKRLGIASIEPHGDTKEA